MIMGGAHISLAAGRRGSAIFRIASRFVFKQISVAKLESWPF